MSPHFTIITITYNAERYLAQTLASVAMQQGVEYEHIIWDGGSSDTTLDVVRSFPHVQLFQGQDRGIADAMNKGAEKAQGKFLLHLHADDFLLHAHILKMVERAFFLHPAAKWLYGQAHIVNETGSLLRTTPFEPFTARRLRRYNFITHPSCFIARSFFEKMGGFDPSLKYCMDYDLWLRLSNLSRPLALATPLSAFREHTGSLSTSVPLEVADEAYLVRNRYVHPFYERFHSYLTWKKRRKKLLKFA